ncbi:hypothetical protein VTJ49DRAFT_4342 [Mycothermus thermophilus]|uniref:Uncharacterized protein n=1 Tax=Humicola insolens TaxID=85995 RepID=A0ABR3V6H8_HUMIN
MCPGEKQRKTPKPTRVAELERRLEDLTARIASVQRLGGAELDHQQQHGSRLPSHSPGMSVVGDPDDPLEPPQAFSGTQAFGGPAWEPSMGHVLFPSGPFFDHDVVHPNPQHGGDSTSGSMPFQGPTTGPQIPAVVAPMADHHHQSSSPQHHQQQTHHEHEHNPWPEGTEAETMLNTYRQRMQHLFPFVIVPPHLSSDQLQEQRPFLWKAVMVESCLFDGPRQDALGKQLLCEVGKAALIHPQKSLDLLHGLQMLIAWYHYNLDNFQMANLLFLARSITSSLCSDESDLEAGPDGKYSSECLERMRALAGTYYLVTITFTINKKPEALMNHPSMSYLAACCRVLHRQREHPTDELLVHLVRAQQLSQSIAQVFGRLKAGTTPTPGTGSESRRQQQQEQQQQQPSPALTKSLLDRVRTFASTLPPHIRTNVSHLQVAEMFVYENSLEDIFRSSRYPGMSGQSSQQQLLSMTATTRRTSPTLTPLPTPGTTTPQSGGGGGASGSGAATGTAARPSDSDITVDSERITMLWHCVRLVSSFMAARFSSDVEDYPCLTCLSSFHITYVFVMMLRLATLQVPGWDLARDLTRDLGSGLWGDDSDVAAGLFSWDAVFAGEAMDWIVDYT